jgi:2-aminoadipate transaminase
MGVSVNPLDDLISFAPGYPDADGFPWTELCQIAVELLDGHDVSVLQYGPTRGHFPLIEALVPVQKERGISVSSKNLLITTGSQQGIDLIARVLLDPGDVVLVELPTYTGAISAFANSGARIAGVRQDDQGIDVEDLARVYTSEQQANRQVKLLYLSPNFQNPTGILLETNRRREIIDWAADANILIVEDDPYGTLYFNEAITQSAIRPMFADDEHGRIIYLSTFSKTLAPGFRVGWMVADADMVERCEAVKQSLDLLTGTLDQHVVLEALRRDLPNRLAPKLRSTYKRRLALMEGSLRKACGSDLQWTTPNGGFFLWALLPPTVDDETLLQRALERKLVFVAGSAFFVNGRGHDRIRLSYSSVPERELEEGVARLAAAIGDCRNSEIAADAQE